MFEHLRKFQHIFVTGPHRSGTTICAKMVAHDTGHDLVLEDDFNCSNITQMSTFAHAGHAPVVIQCPFLADIIHDLEYLIGLDMDRSCVLFMQRNREEIIASEKKAKTPQGLSVDFKKINRGQVCRYRPSELKHISDIKKEAWRDQKAVIPNHYDIYYNGLRAHSLWIDNRNFSVRQTNQDEIVPDIPATPLPKIFENALTTIRNI